MLRFHVLNVEKGDSIVIECLEDDKHSFALIDSNITPGERHPKALAKLEELGAKELSFVCMTHPHADHYLGLSQIFEKFQGKIGQVILCPLGHFIGKKSGVLSEKYLTLLEKTDDEGLRIAAYEFIRILRALSGMPDVMEYSGPSSCVGVDGFDNVQISCHTPFKSFKNSYFERIEKGDPNIFEDIRENDLSLSILFEYGGKKVLLGGDTSHKNWAKHLGWQKNNRTPSIASHAVKMPHHGSKHDCREDMFTVAFEEAPEEPSIALISANGRTHPDKEVLMELEDRGIQPYCTNLHSMCGANVQEYITTTGIAATLGRTIQELAISEKIQPCQGDITLTIDSSGAMTVNTEHNFPCGFRNDYGDLFSASS